LIFLPIISHVIYAGCATKGSCNRVSLEIGSGRKTYKPSCDMGGF